MGEAIIFHGRGYTNNTPSISSENGALIRVHTTEGIEITIKNIQDNRQLTKIAESKIVEFDIGTRYGTWVIYKNKEEKSSIIVDALRIYDVNLDIEKTYGFRIHTDGSVTYTDDAQDMTPVSYNEDGTFNYGSWEAFIKSFCKPCLLSYDGSEIIYLNPDDYTESVDGDDMSSYITGQNSKYNVMIEFCPLLYRFESSRDGQSLTYTDFKVSSCKGNIGIFDDGSNSSIPVYFSAYEGILKDDSIHSLSGVTPSMYYYDANEGNTAHNQTDAYWLADYIKRSQFSVYGNYKENYNLEYWKFRSYILSLLVLICRNLNIESILGAGVSRASNSNNNNLSVTGNLNKKGLFAKNDSTGVIKCFGIENFWGNSYSIIQDSFSFSGTSPLYLYYGEGDYSIFDRGTSSNNYYTPISNSLNDGFAPFSNKRVSNLKLNIQDSICRNGMLVGGCGTDLNDSYGPFFIALGDIYTNISIVGSGNQNAGYINPRLTYKKIV